MSTMTSATLGMPAPAAGNTVAFVRAPQSGVACGSADPGYAKRNDIADTGHGSRGNRVTATTVRVGAGRTADVKGARAWSPPV